MLMMQDTGVAADCQLSWRGRDLLLSFAGMSLGNLTKLAALKNGQECSSWRVARRKAVAALRVGDDDLIFATVHPSSQRGLVIEVTGRHHASCDKIEAAVIRILAERGITVQAPVVVGDVAAG